MIHFFNPGHEVAVLNDSPFYMPPSNVMQMASELSLLPFWYAQSGDYIFVTDDDSKNYCQELNKKLNANIIAFTESDIPQIESIIKGQKAQFWGISLQAIHFWTELNNKYQLELSIPRFDNAYRDLCSRKFSNNILDHITQRLQQIDKKLLPRFFTDLTDIEEYVANTKFRLLAKAPYSSSGRGLLWLPIAKLTRTELQILHGILRKQGSVSIERVLEKQIDFAMEFLIDPSEQVFFSGYSVFETNGKGAYIGNYLDSQANLERKILSFIDSNILENTKSTILALLKEYIAPHYQGCLGVDMLLYEENGKIKLHPCVEINVRTNMGYLSIHVHEHYMQNRSEGFFRVEFNSKDKFILGRDLELKDKYPLEINNNQIIKGYLPLCPVSEKSKYHAYVIVN
ncbi:MAG: hypothetical protein ACK5MK_11785 [Dysgonomonas sp.]